MLQILCRLRLWSGVSEEVQRSWYLQRHHRRQRPMHLQSRLSAPFLRSVLVWLFWGQIRLLLIMYAFSFKSVQWKGHLSRRWFVQLLWSRWWTCVRINLPQSNHQWSCPAVFWPRNLHWCNSKLQVLCEFDCRLLDAGQLQYLQPDLCRSAVHDSLPNEREQDLQRSRNMQSCDGRLRMYWTVLWKCVRDHHR